MAEPGYDIRICTERLSASKVGYCGSGPQRRTHQTHSTALSQERRGEKRECNPNQPNQTAYGSTATSTTVSDMLACGQKAEVQDIGTNPAVHTARQTQPPAPTGEVWNKALSS